MNEALKFKKNKKKFITFIANTSGNSIPLVMLVALIVMILGGAIAYTTVQVFTFIKNESHSQMTYFAAESALERSMCKLDTYITKDNYALSEGIVYDNETNFIKNIIISLNDNTSLISDIVEVYDNSPANKAKVEIKYSWNGDYTKVGLKKLSFPITITASSQIEKGILKSYGKQAVATRDYTVRISDRFTLNGAAYTLGDLVAKTTGAVPAQDTVIYGNVYAFGTGLANSKVMQQHYNGGICAIDSAVLKIKSGSAYTRNLVRAGTFSEDESSQTCAIVVDKDIVAQGIQVFGSNDSIVVSRDAYTFDDVELSGSNSFIAINGNYFGLNPGEGKRHDTSSAVINAAPLYSGIDNRYMKSRIAINGNVFVNGVMFRIADSSTGLAGHKMEDVALAWKEDNPVYITENIEPDASNYNNYIAALNGTDINGFSVLLQNDWQKDDVDVDGVIIDWEEWIKEIRNAAGERTNTFVSTPPLDIKGFCNVAMSANNRIYLMNRLNSINTQVVKPGSISCKITEQIMGVNLFEEYKSYWDDKWDVYTSESNDKGMPAALKRLMGILEDHVQVFAIKEYDNINLDNINYSFTPGSDDKTLFMKLSDYFETNVSGNPKDNRILRYDATDTAPSVDVIHDLEYAFSGAPFDGYHFIILNFNPNKELIISGEVNGIIFSLGKVIIKKDGKVNGAVIAAGRGYDPSTSNKIGGSAAEYYTVPSDGSKIPRLPKVTISENGETFKNWGYAALVFENGGSIVFSNREALLTDIKTSTGIDLINVF